MKIKYSILTILFTLSVSCFALPFNSNLSATDIEKLNSGKVVIKNIDYAKFMCLDSTATADAAKVVSQVKAFNPKYLAEIIQIKPYAGNENYPEKLDKVLNDIPAYAGIPYWSERHERYYDLYSSAKIISTTKDGNKSIIKAQLEMEPFGQVDETINLEKTATSLLYSAKNTNDLYFKGVYCVGKEKMKIFIYLFKYEDNWIFYGVGGVNAPHAPFVTERVRTSFINRIKTFCNFVFKKL